MTAILMSLLPLALKIIGMAMDKKTNDVELQKKWIAFLEKASESFSNSTSLKQSYDAQKARMDLIEKEGAQNASQNK